MVTKVSGLCYKTTTHSRVTKQHTTLTMILPSEQLHKAAAQNLDNRADSTVTLH